MIEILVGESRDSARGQKPHVFLFSDSSAMKPDTLENLVLPEVAAYRLGIMLTGERMP